MAVALERIEQSAHLFKLFLLLHQDRHDNGLERPRARDHNPCLYVKLGEVKEPVKDHLIGFGERALKGRPAAAFTFNQLAEWRQRLAHGVILP